MEDRDGINVTETLMDIRERLAKIESNTSGLNSTDEKAEKALAKSVENEHDISKLTSLLYWLYGLFIGTGIVGIGIYILEKFL